GVNQAIGRVRGAAIHDLDGIRERTGGVIGVGPRNIEGTASPGGDRAPGAGAVAPVDGDGIVVQVGGEGLAYGTYRGRERNNLRLDQVICCDRYRGVANRSAVVDEDRARVVHGGVRDLNGERGDGILAIHERGEDVEGVTDAGDGGRVPGS